MNTKVIKPLPPPSLPEIAESIESEKGRIKFYLRLQQESEAIEKEFTERSKALEKEHQEFREKLWVAEERITEAKNHIVRLEKLRHDLRSQLSRKGNPAKGPTEKYPTKPKWMTDEQFENFMKNVEGFQPSIADKVEGVK